MSPLSNAHTHSTYCDGRDSIPEMIAKARALGFVSIGFSEHAEQGFDTDYCMSENAQSAYFAELRGIQHAGLRVWAGLEQDALTPEEGKARNRGAADYIIGSTHYLRRAFEGKPISVDGDRDALVRAVAAEYAGDAVALAEEYYALHADMLERDRPDIIGHFDLVRKYAAFIGLNTRDARYRGAAQDALVRARRTGAVLEVNTGAMARGCADTPYPEDFLLRVWRELDGEVIVSSDCHNAQLLDFGFADVMDQLRRLGYRRALRLGTGDALWDELPL